jgi:uncharacterized protein YjdB
VNGDGHSISIKGVAEGTAVITATTQDGGKAAQCEVTVRDTPVEVTDITLAANSLSMVIGEAPFILRAQINPWYANVGNNLTWSATPADIITITDTTTEDTNLVKQVSAVGEGDATITITSGNGVTATCTVHVVLEDLAPDIKNVTVRAGSASKLYSVFRPASIVPQVAAVTWESLNPAIATVSAEGSSGLDSFSATVTGVSSGTTRIKITARGLESYAEVTVLPAWNIAGDWFFEDFEDYRFTARNPELSGDYPLNQTAAATVDNPAEGVTPVLMQYWTVNPGLTNTAATFSQIVAMENSMPGTDTLGGENKVARHYAAGTGDRGSQYNFRTPIAGERIYAEFDWYPASPGIRWGLISLNDRAGSAGNDVTNKFISFRTNAAMELSYNVGNIAETTEESGTTPGIRLFESLDSSYYWFHIQVAVDFTAGTISFVMTHLETGASESATVPLPAEISYNRQIASMRLFLGRADTAGWANVCLDNVYIGTAPMPQD